MKVIRFLVFQEIVVVHGDSDLKYVQNAEIFRDIHSVTIF